MSEVLEEILKEQREFIIIGLTGRTGSGCTTVANILTSELLQLSEPVIHENISNEGRKDSIIYKFIQERWSSFTKIKVSDIITSFIFDYPEDFLNNIKAEYKIEENEEIRQKYETLKNIYREKKFDLNDSTDVKPEEVYAFYFKDLVDFSDCFKKYIGDKYTSVFQDMGDNLRGTGHINNNNSNGKKLLKVQERINLLIKKVEDYIEKKLDRKKYFVIDAIRNPFEALFFRQRFSAFYLISINSPNEDRLRRLLITRKLNYSKIEDLDEREYPKNKHDLIILNVKKCIENADIHIENPDNSIFNNFSNLNKLLARYLSLIMHPGLVTPTKIERCMQVAFTAKYNSGCISRQVGAVVTDENYSIKSVGWNDTPQGQTPCLLRSMENLLEDRDPYAYSDYEVKGKELEFKNFIAEKYRTKLKNPKFLSRKFLSRNYSYCFKDEYNQLTNKDNQVYSRALHAEENSFLQISKYGGSGIENGILFTSASPCELCSKKAYQLGIKKIIYIDPYPGISLTHILGCGMKRPTMELFTGAIGRAYHKLFEPIISYKDEISLLLGDLND